MKTPLRTTRIGRCEPSITARDRTLVRVRPAWPTSDGPGALLVLRSSMGVKLGVLEVAAVVVIDHAEAAVRPAADRCGRGAQDPQAGRSATRSGGLDPAGTDRGDVLGRDAGAGHRGSAGVQSEGGALPAGPVRRRGAGRVR